MRIQIPIVVEMTDEQVKIYAEANGLPHGGGPLRAKDVVEDVRDYVLVSVQGIASLYEVGAEVSIKR